MNGAQLLSTIDGRRCEEFTFGNKDDCAVCQAEQFYEDARVPARTLPGSHSDNCGMRSRARGGSNWDDKGSGEGEREK